MQKCEPQERSPCAPKFEERRQEETLQQERCARRVARDLAKNVMKLKDKDKATFYSPTEAWVMPAPSSKKPEEREFVVDSRSINAHAEQKVLSSDELDTLRKPRNSTMVVTPLGKCKSTRKHRYTSTILQCNYSMTRLPSCHWANSAKSMVIQVSGPVIKSHTLPRVRKGCCARRKISCLLLSQDCRQAPAQVRLLVSARLIEYVFESSKFTKWRYLPTSGGKLTRSPQNQKPKQPGNRLRDLPEESARNCGRKVIQKSAFSLLFET